MDQKPLLYRDVTDLSAAAQRANPTPLWRAQLLAIGFRRVGLLEIRPDDATNTLPEADLLSEPTQPGNVIEVLTSPDRHAFATFECVADEWLLCLRTITEKGVVIETAMQPTRPASSDTSLRSLAEHLPWLAARSSARWPHANRPRAGYHVALSPTRDPQELVRQHRQRLGVLQWSNYTTIRRHNTLRLYSAIIRRAYQISEHDGHIEHRIAHSLATAIMLPGLLLPFVFLFVVLLGSQPAVLSPLPDGLLRYGPALALVPTLLLFGLYFLLIGWVRGTLLPRWPGPTLQPVTSLMAEVRL
jgi:hypothetical protein